MWAVWLIQCMSNESLVIKFGDKKEDFGWCLFKSGIRFRFARRAWLETCFSLCGNLLAGFLSFDCPDGDSVEDPWLQAGHGMGGGVGPHWELPTGTLWWAATDDVTIFLGLGRIPWDREAGLSYVTSWEVSRSVQFWRGVLAHDIYRPSKLKG